MAATAKRKDLYASGRKLLDVAVFVLCECSNRRHVHGCRRVVGALVTEALGAQRRVLALLEFVARKFLAISFLVPNAQDTAIRYRNVLKGSRAFTLTRLATCGWSGNRD